MYKLIALDLDGTLLDSDKRISEENLDLINHLISKDYEVVIATGRRYWSAKQLTKKINGHITIIANNGNIVRNSLNDRIISSKYLEINDFKNIISIGKERNLHPIVHVDGYEEGIDFVIEENKLYLDYVKKDKRYKEVSDLLNIVNDKILAVVYANNKNTLYPFYKDIKEKYPNNYNAHLMENMDLSEAMLEVMHPLGSKWLSLKDYASSLNIKPEEIISIGDNNNDICMVENSGLGIAMKNASPMLKSVAGIISERDNDHSGVAFELKRVLSI